MAKYRVTFTETATYTVEFESKYSLKQLEGEKDGAPGEEPWFTAMDEFDGDWYKKSLCDVTERGLDELEKVTKAPKK